MALAIPQEEVWGKPAHQGSETEAVATRGETMEPETKRVNSPGIASRSLAELLACPASTGDLLSASAQLLDYEGGETIFRQGDACRGLYVILSGQFLRKAERVETRLVLGSVHAGSLVELSAVLGDRRHTCTLSVQCAGSVMLLPFNSLHQAFVAYPPLRMRLLEELAREVSRAYAASNSTRLARMRRGIGGSSNA
jgi:CRP-like cAMP-binding protein